MWNLILRLEDHPRHRITTAVILALAVGLGLLGATTPEMALYAVGGVVYLGVVIAHPPLGTYFYLGTFLFNRSVVGPFGTSDFVLAGALAATLIKRKGFSVRLTFTEFAALVLILAATVSIPGSIVPDVAVSQTLLLVKGVIVFVLCKGQAQDRETIGRMVYALLLGAGIAVLYALFETAMISFGTYTIPVGAKIPQQVTAGVYRLYFSGLNGDPNAFGHILASSLAISWYIAVTAERRIQRAASFLLTAVLGVGLVLTVSRGAILAAFVGLLTPLMLRSPRKLLAVMLLGAVMAWGVSFLGPDLSTIPVLSRFMQGLSMESDQTRLAIWSTAWNLFLQHPFTGIGYNTFAVYSETFAGQLGVGYWRLSTHNALLETLVGLGVVGGLAFAFLLAFAWNQARSLDNRLGFSAPLAGLSALIASNLVDVFLHGSQNITMFWFAIALAGVRIVESSKDARQAGTG